MAGPDLERRGDVGARLGPGAGYRPAPPQPGCGRRRLWIGVGLLVPLALAACGASHSPAVARIGTTTASSAPPAGTSLDRFAACLHTHGVPKFPEPIDHGTSLRLHVGPGSAIDPGSPQYESARDSCGGLLPHGGGLGRPTVPLADRIDYLMAAACIRSHGVPDFPDPRFAGGEVSFHIPSTVSPTSPLVARAIATCRKLIPPGLPYGA